jgi:hypothetical protein
MEQWMVMGAAILVIGMLYPPLFGVVIGAGGIMLVVVVAYKFLGG